MTAPATTMLDQRRDRLIRFIEPWLGTHRQYQPRIGDGHLSLDCLTNAALEILAQRIARDFWFTRRINRENRRIARVGVR